MIPTYLPKPQSNCPSPYRLIRTLSFHFFYWILLSPTTLTVPTTCSHSILPSGISSTTSEIISKSAKNLKFSGPAGARAKSMRLDFTIMPPGRPPGGAHDYKTASIACQDSNSLNTEPRASTLPPDSPSSLSFPLSNIPFLPRLTAFNAHSRGH